MPTDPPPHPPSSTDLAVQRTQLADERTDLAVTRTLIALDRTLMAWIRTATSLISFGFTIYKVFQQLRGADSGPQGLMEPRTVALVLMGLGIGGLAIATIEYRSQVEHLRERFHAYGPFRRSMTAGIAAVLSCLGVLGFVLVFLRQ
jgi:putative membrane protein